MPIVSLTAPFVQSFNLTLQITGANTTNVFNLTLNAAVFNPYTDV